MLIPGNTPLGRDRPVPFREDEPELDGLINGGLRHNLRGETLFADVQELVEIKSVRAVEARVSGREDSAARTMPSFRRPLVGFHYGRRISAHGSVAEYYRVKLSYCIALPKKPRFQREHS